MFVQINEAMQVKIYWAYERTKKTTYTHCLMANPIDGTIIATGYTKLAKGDVFLKKEGRKRSLTNLFVNHTGTFTKEERTNVWKKYAEMVHDKF